MGVPEEGGSSPEAKSSHGGPSNSLNKQPFAFSKVDDIKELMSDLEF